MVKVAQDLLNVAMIILRNIFITNLTGLYIWSVEERDGVRNKSFHRQSRRAEKISKCL